MADSAGIQQGSPAIGAAGLVPAAPGAGGTEGSGAARGSARIAVKKAQLRSSPRPKKLEKLGVYSSCKVCHICKSRALKRGSFRGSCLKCAAFPGLGCNSFQNASTAKEAIAALEFLVFFLLHA